MKVQLDPKENQEFVTAVAKEMLRLQDERKPPTPPVENIRQEYFYIKEVSQMTGISEDTIRRHIKAGILIASQPGKYYRISQSDLTNYIERNKNQKP